MKSLEQIKYDNKPKRVKGEVAAGRARRRRAVLTYAKMQLAGGVPWGEVFVGRCSLFVCQKCGAEYHLTAGYDVCAFCDDCKNDVLDMLAEAVVNAAKKRRK